DVPSPMKLDVAQTAAHLAIEGYDVPMNDAITSIVSRRFTIVSPKSKNTWGFRGRAVTSVTAVPQGISHGGPEGNTHSPRSPDLLSSREAFSEPRSLSHQSKNSGASNPLCGINPF